MTVKLSSLKQGVLGIVGHAGCGHANSHLGFIQDDSGGLSAVMAILRRATGIDLTITSVEVRTGRRGSFTVRTAAGGCAQSAPRRGITPYEARLAQYVVGKQAVCSQALSMEAFGRTLGQGAMEVPVALQTAIANAAMDSFVRTFPDKFIIGSENVRGNEGRVLGCVLDVDGIAVSLMGLANATSGGLGPNEDIEGNVNLAGKEALMRDLALDRLPTILIEGKVCAGPVSPVISVPTFVTRAYPGDDNTTVSECLLASAEKLGYPIVYPRELLARKKGSMRDLTARMGERIIAFGQALRDAATSEEKVRIAAELNRFASEDLGGITFMSDDVHEVMGGVGMIPGTSGCLSLFIPTSELEEVVYPALSIEDTERYADVILGAVPELMNRRSSAMAELEAARGRATNHGLSVR
ncbi:MAG: hypothetical protein IJ164_06080 [Duodenibacillus sp.]|nr:hypothetical protein [Duodenibacillus sp.]